jgi:hypothetical protein
MFRQPRLPIRLPIRRIVEFRAASFNQHAIARFDRIQPEMPVSGRPQLGCNPRDQNPRFPGDKRDNNGDNRAQIGS